MRSLRLAFLLAVCVSLHAQTVHFSVDSAAMDGDAGIDGVCLSFSGHCTLQAAMDEVNAPQRAGGMYVIDFNPCFGAGGTTIKIPRGFEISSNVASLTITGHFDDRIVLDGSSTGGAFFYVRSPNTSFTMRYLTLQGGGSWDGDAAIQSWGTLTLDSVIIRYHAGAWGGGVYVGSGLTPGVAHIRNSAFYGNYAFNGGSAIYVTHNGGALPAELDLTNSTISGNYARGLGAIAINGHATIRNTTIVNNESEFGIAFWGFNAILDLGNSIVASNTHQDLFDDTFYPTTFIDAGNNIIGDSSNETSRLPIAFAPSDLLNTNPMIGPLDENGGPTPTHALLAGSPAINGGNTALAASLTSDQRNFQRVSGGIVDIGAYEAGATQLPAPPDAPPSCHPAKQTPLVTVTGGTFMYDGNAHPATATVTNASGAVIGTASITYGGSSSAPVEAGTYDVVATFAGDANYESASGTGSITITPAPPKPTSIVYDGATYLLAGAPAQLSAVLTVGNQPITLTLGTQSCSTVTDAAGRGSCTIASVNQPLGPGVVTATFAGTSKYLASSTSAATLVYAYPAGGNFVIAPNSGNVTFWGAQWAKINSINAPAAFKGYVNRPATPSCGGTWSTDPGNSSQPPAAIPSYMAVIVSSSISQSGSNISGNVVKIAIVKTDAGYQGNPGHAGTGTVVAVICR